ncbi:hypothetical protein GCM10010532_012750 [Dactylosporangium siamense]
MDTTSLPYSTNRVSAGLTPTGVAFTPDSSRAYVSMTGMNTVFAYATSTGMSMGPTMVNNMPKGVTAGTVSGNPRVYVANFGLGSVTVIDGATGGIVAQTVPTAMNPVAVGFVPGAGKVLIAHADSTVWVLDTSNNTASWPGVMNPPIGSMTTSLAVAPDGQTFYLGAGSGVYAFDATTYARKGATIAQSGTVGQIAVSPDSETVYATSGSGSQGVYVYRADSFANALPVEPSDTITLPGSVPAEGVAVDPGGSGRLYVTTGSDGKIVVASPQTSIPGNPTQAAATAGSGQADVAWEPPALSGGSLITAYTAQAYAGGVLQSGRTCTLSSPFTPPLTCTVTGLTGGTAYTFKVTATNGSGAGADSAESAPVTPTAPAGTAPGAPTIGTATAGQGQADVTWTAPLSDGGNAITSYTVQAYAGGVSQSGKTCTLTSPFTPPLTCTVTGLTNGTGYTFRVTATNGVGTGSESGDSSIATPAATAPGAPTIGAATAGQGQVAVAWTAPASTGGSAITSYTVQAYAGGVSQSGKTCTLSSPFTPPLTCTVTGLTNGTGYTFRVTATNGVGTGSESGDSSIATPAATAPGAPTIGAATAGQGQVAVAWTAPASTGGSAITSYTVQAYAGGVSQSGKTCTLSSPFTPPLTCTVTGLTNGTGYTFRVTATNGIGTGSESGDSSTATPATTVPGAPTIGTATAGQGQVAVVWTAPASTGGSAITSYTVQAYAGGVSQSGKTCTLTSPFTPPLTCTVSTLTNGTGYTFRVTATNGVGTGSESGDSPTATPGNTAPGAPTIGTATAGQGQADVTWTAPGSDGGAAITSYTVQAYAGGVPQAGKTCTLSSPFTPPLTCPVLGLTNGTGYTFRVTATNSVGTGPASGDSPLATPAATAPGAPTIGTATAGQGQVAVTWSAPAANGSPISGYTVQAYAGGVLQAGRTCAVSPPAVTCTVSGLTNGTGYTFRVTATNGVGTGPASGDSATATPAATAPGAPTGVAATTDTGGSVSVTFTAPATNGGSAITGYTVTAQPGGRTGTCASSPCTVTGLTVGTSYTFTARATNGAGSSPESTPSAALLVAVAPGAPTAVTAVPGDGTATVSFTPPAATGGTPITGYTVTVAPGGRTVACAAPPCTVTGLSNGDPVTFTVRATNAKGDSPESAAGAAVTPLPAPPAPASPTATASASAVTVTWTASAAANVTGYTVTASPGPATCTTRVTDPNPTSCVVGGVAGTTYTYTVTAESTSGPSPASPPSTATTVAAPATPATPPPTELTLTTDRGDISTAVPGQQITVIGTGFAPHSTATITIYSTPTQLGTVVTDENGNFSVPVTVPAALAAGVHTVVALGAAPDGSLRAMDLTVTVGARSSSGALPVTGAAAARLAVVGLLAIAAGVLLVRTTRAGRRRRPGLLPPGSAYAR